MKKYYYLFLLTFVSFVAFGNNDPAKAVSKFNQKQNEINDQMFKVQEIDRILNEEHISYKELSEKYPDLVSATNLTATIDDGIMEKSPDSPLGIPGFWWGFCLGWIGMLIVYLSMDEGQDRKDQVKNALIGCVVWAGLWLIFYVALWGVIFSSTVDATQTISAAITGSC